MPSRKIRKYIWESSSHGTVVYAVCSVLPPSNQHISGSRFPRSKRVFLLVKWKFTWIDITTTVFGEWKWNVNEMKWNVCDPPTTAASERVFKTCWRSAHTTSIVYCLEMHVLLIFMQHARRSLRKTFHEQLFDVPNEIEVISCLNSLQM